MGLWGCQGPGAKGCLGAWAVGGIVGTAWGGEAVVAAGAQSHLDLLFEITECGGSCSALHCTACGQL